MPDLDLTLTRLAGSEDVDLLVVGPSLGTAVEPLWRAAAAHLADRFEVVGWDLPGHGRSAPATDSFTVADLAAAVTSATERLLASGGRGRRTAYAGVSLGGAVALQLALSPAPFSRIVSIASAPRIGDPTAWRERAALVRGSGTPVMVEGSARRWFAPGFIDRDPTTAAALLHSLSDADAESYALACEALADFDITHSLRDLPDNPERTLLVAGEQDPVITPEAAVDLTAGTPVRTLTLGGCGHLPPAEVPGELARVLVEHIDTNSQEER